MAVDTSGNVYSFGMAKEGQCGFDAIDDQLIPTKVGPDVKFVRVDFKMKDKLCLHVSHYQYGIMF